MLQHKKETTKNRLEIWRKALEERGTKISRKKTEYLCDGGRKIQEGNIRLQDIDVLRVKAFKCLGSTVQDDGGEVAEV